MMYGVVEPSQFWPTYMYMCLGTLIEVVFRETLWKANIEKPNLGYLYSRDFISEIMWSESLCICCETNNRYRFLWYIKNWNSP